MEKILILGAGAFGFAIAKLVSENHYGKEIFIFDVNEEFIEHIHKTRTHPIFHENTKLPAHVTATKNLEKAVKGADLIILAIPTKFIRDSIKEFKHFLTQNTVFLSLVKGLENKTNKRVSEILDEELKDIKIDYEICCLSGGMIAREVTLKSPLCADLACENKTTAKKVAKLLRSDYLRIETTDDLIGVELAGAFKNVIAIGAGIFDGLGYTESSKSAFVSAAAKQMRELAIALGAKHETFGPGSQAWLGDLMTTCFGKSRNRELGELIGKGIEIKEAIETMIKSNKSIEGYITTEVVHSLIKKHNINASLLHAIYNVLYENENPKAFVKNFIKS